LPKASIGRIPSARHELAMALDLAGGNQNFAGAEGTEPAHCGFKAGRFHWGPANIAGEQLKRPRERSVGISVGRLEEEAGRWKRPVAGGMPAPGKVRGKP
jgi:hypothetical protein